MTMPRATGSRRLPAHDDMVAAIVETYRRASVPQLESGGAWYDVAGRIVRTIADETRLPVDRVAAALAALSPRNPWRWNVADCYAFAAAYAADPYGPIPTATTFTVNRENAWLALAGDLPWRTRAPKVHAFVAAILGYRDAVVVDTWAIRVATRGAMTDVRNGEYETVVAAYRAAARILGTRSSDVQAVTWVVAQAEGIASSRRGRNDETFKRGTPDAVRAMFGDGTMPVADSGRMV